MKEENPTASDSSISTLTYHVTALQITIYFNKEGDHDHNGLIFALTENVPILKYIRALARVGLPQKAGDHGGHDDTPEEWYKQAKERAQKIGVSLPSNPQEARQPHPLVRPLVLRARKCDRLQVELHNQIQGRCVGLHLVADGYDVKTDDGSHVGRNASSLVAPDNCRTYTWQCLHEGVFPFHDGGNYSGGEEGTNVHGLFGALAVEPAGAIWRDPVTGRRSVDQNGNFHELDGLYLDILPPGKTDDSESAQSDTTLDNHQWPPPEEYPNFDEAHREFVIFFHDEPEFQPPHGKLETSPCEEGGSSGGGGHTGGHGGHADNLPIMPISYRSEPMINRERILWGLLRQGHVLKRPVLNEEQHHSSWMFGDPVTPILKAYIGDPVRIRLLHAGVKETHVFHLHLYEWHAVPQDKCSPRIDAISISPQTGHTIEPVWGAGNRHQVAGDVIWHCHLYPHFHEGMWGMFRTFETLQEGKDGDALQSRSPIYASRRIGRYPDGTPIERLLPLPGREPPPRPTLTRPGYPLYIPGEVRQKSPTPPWPLKDRPMPADFDYRPMPTDLERNAFNNQPVPGEMFTRNPFAKQQDEEWKENPKFEWNDSREVSHNVVVKRKRIEYNRHDWHDPDGHLFYLPAEGDPDTRPGPKEPLFFRAQHGQILNLTLANRLPRTIAGTPFDPPFPPCPSLPWEGECAMHVHMVKFDPICGDGASVGWNYISGPRFDKKMVYRWWADQEFGTIFFHDHLFANYRQKHGLFGALIVEPIGAKFYDNFSNREIVSGLQARIKLRESVQTKVARTEGLPDTNWFREFCIGIGDFIPMFNRAGEPLNPPDHPGGHGDQGVMALNYRNEPIRERGGNPAFWFSSWHHPDPDTTRFGAFGNDPIWIRLVQGSHEEQHSFQIHGMRWRRFRVNVGSPIRNQQSLGIAEAFTFINHEQFGPGDYLYKLSGADDLWLGCWGLIRAFQESALPSETGGLRRLQDEDTAAGEETVPAAQTDTVRSGGEVSELIVVEAEAAPETEVPPGASVRSFHVVAEPRRLVYREPDLVDPFGLVYRLVSVTSPDGREHPVPTTGILEPLVLRCREREWVKVTVENRLPEHQQPEPFAPKVPVEERDPRTFRPERPVSSHVSLHADLLEYDITQDDGANVGLNPEQTIPPGASRTYTWYATRLPRRSNADEPIGPVLLQDMADFRNHRHHGLIGALIVEAEDATPLAVGENEATAAENAPEAWYGTRATILCGEEQSEEIVLLLQDGLRLYLNGNVNFPIPDIPADPGEDEPDTEDQGQKGFNYRTEPVGPNDEPRCDCGNSRDWLANPNPATPVWCVPVGKTVRFHLVGACDKPRNHSFTIHGVTWPEWRFLSREKQPKVASESAISCATIRTFEFIPKHTGDHAYRSGVLKWAVSQGLWGILRVVGDTDISG